MTGVKTCICPNCDSSVGHCPECGKLFAHGTAAYCDERSCMVVNAPIDCECGFVVSADRSGVLDFDMKLRQWKDEQEAQQ